MERCNTCSKINVIVTWPLVLVQALGGPCCILCADAKLCDMKRKKRSLCFNYYFGCDSNTKDVFATSAGRQAEKIKGLAEWVNPKHATLCQGCKDGLYLRTEQQLTKKQKGCPHGTARNDPWKEPLLKASRPKLTSSRRKDKSEHLINAKDTSGCTALHNAARCGHHECVRLLLDHPLVDLFIQDNSAQTASDRAISNNKSFCTRQLQIEETAASRSM
eukprot:TRINITY_DN9699_c0_g1_i1.p1 TRINITY_DN9699_c0_g1~~TRINITY_DN9699_c0_g1_i1.p1  ORF type:complete len:218 (+),score=17.36 TRINITY_DN9699_c0_g1_i1:95-748(+)